LGCYGGTSYQTHEIDSLANTGTRFTNCFSMPVCHPSRQTIMTGQYPFRHSTTWGSWPEGVTTFAHLLKRAGYATAVAGKWQLALQKDNPRHPAQLGFDESAVFGWHEGPRFHSPMIYRNGVVWEEKRKPDVYGPEVYTEFLIDFMARNKDRPFFAYYPMTLCHEISNDFDPVPPPGPDGRYRSFAEMVDDMDAAVGRIVDAIDRLGLRRETVILFTTDNGSPTKYLTGVKRSGGKIVRHHKPVISMLGDEAVKGGKGSMTDAGTRVPLLASWPGITPNGHTCNDLIDFSDFLPTLADLANAPLPDDVALDGRSFAPQLKGESGNPRPWVFCEHKGKRWVRNHNWKLYDNGRLFDVQKDVQEKNPIKPANAPAQTALARRVLQNAFESLEPAPMVGFRTKPGELVLTVSDEPVATYVFSDEQIRRPYFAHVKSPGGIQVTRNHPPVIGKDRKDHATMHPGIWMAFGDLDGEDFWRNKGRVVQDGFIAEPSGEPGKGTFTVKNRYERASGEVVCHEERRITMLVRPEGYLLLWDATFSADREFYFGDQEEMGLGFRVTTPITVDNGGRMVDSQGRKNGDGIWGKTAQWCDYSGAVDDRRIGMTLMCHPDNFRPSWMHARDYGFIAANPFGRNAFTEGEPSKVVVKSGEEFRLRYGVWIHDGPRGASPNLAAVYQDYLTLSRAN
ncbi:MAG: sulfatase-like hydrolase/transferase, partial [Planctomycetes bacterium]|nr:sulfatase-like hydrolase/transferase [Planctomycetota bacterium]